MLTDQQVETLNLVQALAERHAVVLDLDVGDMVFWNNHGLLHARNGFTDSAEHKRHLVRLWLHNDQLGWRIPGPIQNAWNGSFEPRQKQHHHWPLAPISDAEYITTQQRVCGHS